MSDTIEDMKKAVSNELSRRRRLAGWSQRHLARLLGSSQSRIATMEADPGSASLDLLFRALLETGASPHEIGRAVAGDIRGTDEEEMMTGAEYIQRIEGDNAVMSDFLFEEPRRAVSMYGPVLRPRNGEWRLRHALAANDSGEPVRALLLQPRGGHMHGDASWQEDFGRPAHAVLEVVLRASPEAFLTRGLQQITVPFRGYSTLLDLVAELREFGK